MNREEIAIAKRNKGYNCAQSVACTYCEDFGLSEAEMFRITEGLGTGLGCTYGTCGALAAAYSVNPDFGINLDVTGTGDTPECDPVPMKLGGGPTVKYLDDYTVVTKPVIEFMHAVAEKHGIRVQNEVLPYGGTDTYAVQPMRGGKAACCVSIATRYIHSPIETADLSDCLSAVDYVRAMAEEQELPLA